MVKNSALLQNCERPKTCWSLSTEHEQMELWDYERQILNQVADGHAFLIFPLQWGKTTFKTIFQQSPEAA